MAGVMTVGDEGRPISIQQVPDIDGEGTAPVVASAHLTDGPRAEGVAYPEAFGSGPTGSGYPAGTAMTDSTPGDNVN